ncbi:prepilin-type N-terminal cleavage/methylation domain-containing protein [Lysobacter firmicutimachus]|uniref:Prepilin-type N-terminal cleavage/methylation domain-containing protein n=1 Tax=Lysobacter firmicutimachus TaxID=1792846 RepID=A0AAU8N096_9GAMM|nr:prepilin-type N-terminal cleavage/methylation domain-containing protein [Lysobacter antibioticus]
MNGAVVRPRLAPRAAARGFTLIEVLLAMVLLVAGLTLAFATLSAATKTAARGESLAQRSERERAVVGFLRKRIAATRPIPFAFDQSTAVPQRFVGEPDRLRFVADLPDYLGQGGPYLHDFAIESDGDQARMVLSLSMVLAGETIKDPQPRPPELLVDGLKSARFRYRSIDPQRGELGEWQERWTTPEQLPLFVEATFVDRDGRRWPPLIVSLPLATASGGFVPEL